MFRQPQPRHRGHQPQQQLANIALPDVDQLGPILLRTANRFATRHRYVTAWYVLGLAVMALVYLVPGTPLTLQQQREYERVMNTIDVQAEFDAAKAVQEARYHYDRTRGWFFSCDATCKRYKSAYQQAEAEWVEIRREGEARASDAKRVAGLTSRVAVTEMQDSFWDYFTAGKRFAKRQTMWDIFWMGLRTVARSRDESWAEYAMKVLMHILINFTMGLVSALVMFVFGLWSIIRSYQPNPLVALTVFLAAAAVATSMVVTYLVALTGAMAGTVYGVAKLAEGSNRARLQQEHQRQRLQRPHAD